VTLDDWQPTNSSMRPTRLGASTPHVPLAWLVAAMLWTSAASADRVRLHLRAGGGPAYHYTRTFAQQSYHTDRSSAAARYRVIYEGLSPSYEVAAGIAYSVVRLGALAEYSFVGLSDTGDAARSIGLNEAHGEVTRLVVSVFGEWHSRARPWFVGFNVGRGQIDGTVCCQPLDSNQPDAIVDVHEATVAIGAVVGARWQWTPTWGGRLALRPSLLGSPSFWEWDTLSTTTALSFALAYH